MEISVKFEEDKREEIIQKLEDKKKKENQHRTFLVNADVVDNEIMLTVNPNKPNELASIIYQLYDITGITRVRPLVDYSIYGEQIKSTSPPPSNKIFLIHGRDLKSLDDLKYFLKNECKLEPVTLKDSPVPGTKHILESIEYLMKNTGYVIALFTPDDVGKLNDDNDDLHLRSRQNVVFEYGWALGFLESHEKIMTLFKGENYSQIEWPSDIAGLHVESYTDFNMNIKNHIKQKLKLSGYST